MNQDRLFEMARDAGLPVTWWAKARETGEDAPERLAFIGKRRNPGDSRLWYQFELVDKPGIVWFDILESDLDCLELS